MAKPKILKDIHKELNGSFSHCNWIEQHSLEVSYVDGESPFAIISYEESKLILAFSVNFDEIQVACNLALLLNTFGPVLMSEQFFITEDVIYWGEEAKFKSQELKDVLEKIVPINDKIH